MMLLLAVILFTRYKKAVTMDLFLSQVFTFTKMTFIVLFLLMDFKYCAYYSLLVVVMWLTMKQPKYDGPKKIMKINNKLEFSQMVESEVNYLLPDGKDTKKSGHNKEQ